MYQRSCSIVLASAINIVIGFIVHILRHVVFLDGAIGRGGVLEHKLEPAQVVQVVAVQRVVPLRLEQLDDGGWSRSVLVRYPGLASSTDGAAYESSVTALELEPTMLGNK